MPVGGGASGYSQHQSDNVLMEETWLLYIVNIVIHSAEWNSTAVFINYDEGGGYYDQATPPVTGGVQLGFRVPMILISPYAKEDYVSNTIMKHASILAFIDYNRRLPALNRFVSYSGLPLDMFNFNSSYPGGFIRRQPLNLAGFFGNLVPSSISFSFDSLRQPDNLSPYFPMPLQISARDLPYAANGSDGSNLSMQNTAVFVPTDYGILSCFILHETRHCFCHHRRPRCHRRVYHKKAEKQMREGRPISHFSKWRQHGICCAGDAYCAGNARTHAHQTSIYSIFSTRGLLTYPPPP